ncbi:MAG: hypothetical protein AAF890_08480, partial [Pseudomonadota bacterium]
EVGKLNMRTNISIAKDLCQTAPISCQAFVFVHSLNGEFLVGDGYLDSLSNSLVGISLRGKALVPLTPRLCVFFFTPSSMWDSPNCASLFVSGWAVDKINYITQVYSKDRLFFVGSRPMLSEAYKRDEFLQFEYHYDPVIELFEGLIERPASFRFNC